MRPNQTFWILAFTLIFVSCRKNPPTPTPATPGKKILLKDITIPHLPSPYYHFEYNADSSVAKVDFDSGLTMYDVFYNGSKISEMRNNIIVNHDTLRYMYDNAGKLFLIKFIKETNVTYRHVFFTYDGDQVKEIDWDHAEGNVGYLIDRVMKFTYYPDGNVKTIADRRPAHDIVPESNSTTLFEQYDDKINVDDLDLTHDGIHDHLFLFQGFRLQRNNARKETFSGSSADNVVGYTVNYNYTYNSDGTPSGKAGTLLYTAGTQAGQQFQVSTSYSYY
ncbi:MAG TPA: hypothetical protein VHD83_28740 [Puia sp.]|nr:hypothetical protein [Puia sp.]